jgi:hypothetical protein
MTARNNLRVRAWRAEEGQAVDVPLAIAGPGASCVVELKSLPGASAIHFVICAGDRVKLRGEVLANPGEVVPLRIELDEEGEPHVWGSGTDVLLLPVDSRYDPLLPVRPPAPPAQLDLAIIVDGTMLSWEEEASQLAVPSAGKEIVRSLHAARLLDSKDLWVAHVEQLIALMSKLVDGRNWRAAVMAFGDQEPPVVTAADLRPRYVLHPAQDERTLQRLDLCRLREKLLALPGTSGADVVDALADALHACAHLRWRSDARKIVLLTGDSPGFSLLHALPKGADLCVRRRDVETQALALHRLGVEILTIYHPPPARLGFTSIAFQNELLNAARAQYLRLASLPEMAFDAADFEPASAGERIGRISGELARGAALGELVAIREPAPAI